jgi:hypothetical protein
VNPNRYMVFGFQGSGKTTYAAALWHLLDSREIQTVLAKGKHVGEFRYLEEIAQSWCEGWRVERTGTDQVEDVQINLQHPASGAELVLEFTDLPGEKFEKAFSTRLCTPTFVDLVKEASGLLLFVSADRYVDDVTILDALGDEPQEDEATSEGTEPPRESKAVEGSGEGPKSPAAQDSEEPPWEPDKTPLQVRLVDLLEALQVAPFGRKPFKVAVIVSAWDLTDETSAEKWLSKRYPLLDQFLRNGQGALDMRVYGVSAQGGQLSKKGQAPGPDRDRLLALDHPSERIKIVGTDVREHDLTCPLLWLSGLDKKA